MPETVTTVEVTLRADPQDGNDPYEADVRLPIVPRKGDTLSIWDPTRSMGGEVYLDVETVVLCPWAPERIEVWVSIDGYDRDDLKSAIDAAKRNEQP
jgi:hypothetical protein